MINICHIKFVNEIIVIIYIKVNLIFIKLFQTNDVRQRKIYVFHERAYSNALSRLRHALKTNATADFTVFLLRCITFYF